MSNGRHKTRYYYADCPYYDMSGGNSHGKKNSIRDEFSEMHTHSTSKEKKRKAESAYYTRPVTVKRRAERREAIARDVARRKKIAHVPIWGLGVTGGGGRQNIKNITTAEERREQRRIEREEREAQRLADEEAEKAEAERLWREKRAAERAEAKRKDIANGIIRAYADQVTFVYSACPTFANVANVSNKPVASVKPKPKPSRTVAPTAAPAAAAAPTGATKAIVAAGPPTSPTADEQRKKQRSDTNRYVLVGGATHAHSSDDSDCDDGDDASGLTTDGKRHSSDEWVKVDHKPDSKDAAAPAAVAAGKKAPAANFGLLADVELTKSNHRDSGIKPKIVRHAKAGHAMADGASTDDASTALALSTDYFDMSKPGASAGTGLEWRTLHSAQMLPTAEAKKKADAEAEVTDGKARADAHALINAETGLVRLVSLKALILKSPRAYARLVLSHFPYSAMLSLVAAVKKPALFPPPASNYTSLPWNELLTGDIVHSTLERVQGRVCREWIGHTDPTVLAPKPNAFGTFSLPAISALHHAPETVNSNTSAGGANSTTPLSLLLPVFSAKTGSANPILRRRPLEVDELSHPRLLPRATEFTRAIARSVGSASTVTSYKRFVRNFDAFSSGLFRGVDMTNCVIGGGAVTACLLPVPASVEAAHAEMESCERLVSKLPVPSVLVPVINGYSSGATEAAGIALRKALDKYYNEENLSTEDREEDEAYMKDFNTNARNRAERGDARARMTDRLRYRKENNGCNPFWNSDIDIFLTCATVDEAAKHVESLVKQITANYNELRIKYHRKQSGYEEDNTTAMPDDSFGHLEREPLLVCRTSNAVTLIGGFPFRNVQIIVMLHRSVDEALAFSDLDCTAVAYCPGKGGISTALVNGHACALSAPCDDGRVYAVPRSVRAFNTLCNFVSPARLRRQSTPKRVVKYVARGFTSVLFELCKHTPRCDVIIDEPTLMLFAGMEKTARGVETVKYEESWIPYGPNWDLNRVKYFMEDQKRKAMMQWQIDPKNQIPIPESERIANAKLIDTEAASAAAAATTRAAEFKDPYKLSASLTEVLAIDLSQFAIKPFRWKRDDLLESRLVDVFLPRCYMCLQRFAPSMSAEHSKLCGACSALNASKRAQRAHLNGRAAIVTGGRIKIGYAIALSLARSGAVVVVLTRFPREAAARYRSEPDFADWKDRIHIYGCDLRDLYSVTAFIAHVKLHYPHTFALINNAAQTVRRPPAYYRDVFELETRKHAAATAGTLDVWEAALVKSFTLATANGTAPNPFGQSPADPPRVSLHTIIATPNVPPLTGSGSTKRLLPAHEPMLIEEIKETPKPIASASAAAAVTATAAGAVKAGDKRAESTTAIVRSGKSASPPLASSNGSAASAMTALSLIVGGGGGGGNSANAVSLNALTGAGSGGAIRSAALTQVALLPSDAMSESESRALFPAGEFDDSGEQLDLRHRTSWNSTLEHIPALEVMETQLVNATVPFLLVQELSAIMKARHRQVITTPSMHIREPATAKDMRALWEQYEWLQTEVLANWNHEQMKAATDKAAAAAVASVPSNSKAVADSKVAAVGRAVETAGCDTSAAMSDESSKDEKLPVKPTAAAAAAAAVATPVSVNSAAATAAVAAPAASAPATAASNRDRDAKNAASSGGWPHLSEEARREAWCLEETRRALQRRRMSFIINVSSPEGQFNTRGMKSSEHPHSNMAKASANMLTRTSAPELSRYGVYLTSVDTGWCSRMRSGRRTMNGERAPLTDADGAARVLDPIYSGLKDIKPLSGVLLQDFKIAAW